MAFFTPFPLGFIRNDPIIPLGFIKNNPIIPLGFIIFIFNLVDDNALCRIQVNPLYAVPNLYASFKTTPPI